MWWAELLTDVPLAARTEPPVRAASGLVKAEEASSMRYKLFSLMVGVGLALGTVGATYAADDTTQRGEELGGLIVPAGMTPRAALVKAASDFWSYTAKNWSIMGYASAGQMRAALGGDWWEQTTKDLGMTFGSSGAISRDPCMVAGTQGRDSAQSAQTLPAGQCH